MLEALKQDIRSARRGLWRAKAFTVAATLTLALGITGSTVMFAIVDGVLLRPLRVARASLRMAPSNGSLSRTVAPATFSAPRFKALYRVWKQDGETALASCGSHALDEAVTGGPGRVETLFFGPRIVGQPKDWRRFRSSDVKRRQEPSWTGIEPKQISQVYAVEIECRSRQFVERRVRCNDAGKGAKV